MSPFRTRISFLVLAIAIALPACGKKERTLAVVDGRAITQAEFDAFLKFKRMQPGKVDQTLDEYLEREALAAAVTKAGGLDQAAIDAELREFKKEMVISRYFEKFLAEKVTDDAVRNYYESHRDRYEEKKVHVAHILVRTNKAMSEAERQAKLTTAQQIYGKLQSGGDFTALAESDSEDKISGKKGGDLGWIENGSIDPRFSKKVFEMKQGDTSEPFETAFGFHIIRVLEGAKTIARPFQAVAGDIRHELRTQVKKAELERLTKELKIEKKDAYQPAGSAAVSARPLPSAAPKVLQGASRSTVSPASSLANAVDGGAG